MKVAELRNILRNRTKDELQHLIVEMYKAIPKGVREGKEIDQLIENPDAKKKKTSTKQAADDLDFAIVKKEVQSFLKHAHAQDYLRPNRIVPKKERSGWRFTAKRYIDQVASFSTHPVHSEAALELFEELYKLFCYASGHYVFASTEPFTTLKIEQVDFLKRIILWKKRSQDPEEWIADSLQLILNHHVDRDILPIHLLYKLIEVLDHALLKEKALEIAKKLVVEKQKELKEAPNNKMEYETKGAINSLVEFVFVVKSQLGEKEAAVRFFQKNYLNNRDEVKLYILLNWMLNFYTVDEWLAVYEAAVKKKIKPRDSLQKTYNYIKEKKEFPEYILNY